MAVFSMAEAKHYVSQYRSMRGQSQGSFRAFGGGLQRGVVYTEGTRSFDELRCYALREVDRLLFLAASNYRRSFDLMMPSASAWAHVTMYYGAFFAAKALLGMFGNWKVGKNRIIDVRLSAPGSQELAVAAFATTYHGSHESFWDFFYASVSPLAPLIDPSMRFAITPVAGSVKWQSDNRNDVNYDVHIAVRGMSQFQASFDGRSIPGSLPGTLSTQYRVTEGLLQLAVGFARQLGVRTDALNGLSPKGRRSTKIRKLIFAADPPSVSRSIKRSRVIG